MKSRVAGDNLVVGGLGAAIKGASEILKLIEAGEDEWWICALSGNGRGRRGRFKRLRGAVDG